MMSASYIESLKALEKSAYAIENATYNLKGGFISAAANRAYYACYYSMIALLYTQNIYAKTHQGVKAKFFELFIKTSILPIKFSDSIAIIFDFRQKADYDLDEEISKDEAVDLINQATVFYQSALAYIQTVVADSK